MIKANNPELTSWVSISKNSDFPIQNLPFGIFQVEGRDPVVGVAIGDKVLDLNALQDADLLGPLGLPNHIFRNRFLNDFMALGKEVTRKVRDTVSDLLESENPILRDNGVLQQKGLLKQSECEMLMPVKVGDYTDFYSSKEHATNVGTMFRDPDNALLPNWLHIPVGYHGRASSIDVSGKPIYRPNGQTKSPDENSPRFGPSQRLDFELEIAFITCKETQQGKSISVSEAEDYIFGFCLFNDWSARDIQTWEYVPLGPFLSKNFASTISPWIVTLDALQPFRVEGPRQEPEVLPYLKSTNSKNFNIDLEVSILPPDSKEQVICKSNFKYMYWNINQQLAHQTVNGCNINVGDMYASGTISGPTPDSYGSMLELAWKGTKPLKMADGSERKFINDYDTVIMRGYAKNEKVRVGFGEVRNQVHPLSDWADETI